MYSQTEYLNVTFNVMTRLEDAKSFLPLYSSAHENIIDIPITELIQ